MIKLICFDVDGTLKTDEMGNEGQYVKGIIPTDVLMELEQGGTKIAVVSPSPYLPKRYTDKNHWFKDYGSNSYRWRNVQEAMDKYNVLPSETLYVDDLEANRKQLENYDVKSLSPEEFLEWVKHE